MSERMSSGMRLMEMNEFLHSRMVANATEVSWSSWETASKVKLPKASQRIVPKETGNVRR